MNAMILLLQGAMNMADSLATANPVLTEVNASEMDMLDMAVKGGWIMLVLGVLSVVCFYSILRRQTVKFVCPIFIPRICRKFVNRRKVRGYFPIGQNSAKRVCLSKFHYIKSSSEIPRLFRSKLPVLM